jgi:hypothetical protein
MTDPAGIPALMDAIRHLTTAAQSMSRRRTCARRVCADGTIPSVGTPVLMAHGSVVRGWI